MLAQEQVDTASQEETVELEMDELNQHECMATMTALLNHMQRNNITPKVLEVGVCACTYSTYGICMYEICELLDLIHGAGVLSGHCRLQM